MTLPIVSAARWLAAHFRPATFEVPVARAEALVTEIEGHLGRLHLNSITTKEPTPMTTTDPTISSLLTAANAAKAAYEDAQGKLRAFAQKRRQDAANLRAQAAALVQAIQQADADVASVNQAAPSVAAPVSSQAPATPYPTLAPTSGPDATLSAAAKAREEAIARDEAADKHG